MLEPEENNLLGAGSEDFALMRAVELARRLANEGKSVLRERRSRPRYTVVSEIRIQEVDANLQPLGPKFPAACYSLSTIGIGLVHQQPLRKATLVTIEILRGRDTLRLLAEVMRCRPVVGYYDVGATFVRRLADDATDNSHDKAAEPASRDSLDSSLPGVTDNSKQEAVVAVGPSEAHAAPAEETAP